MEDQVMELLSNSTSAELLVQLEALWVGKGSSKPEASSVQCIHRLFLRLEQVVGQHFRAPQQRIGLIIQLLKLIPPTCSGKTSKFVVQSTMCIDTLEAIFRACLDSLSLKTCPELAETAVILLLQVLQDISQWSYKGPGGPVKGGAVCGPVLIPRILDFLILQLLEVADDTADAIAVQREALATLVVLATSCPANVAAILGCRAACTNLFTACLPTCGDLGTQVDILDLLYRCGKHGSLPDDFLTALAPQAREDFLHFVSSFRGSAHPKDAAAAFEAELCRHAHVLNNSAAGLASVVSVAAEVSSSDALPAFADTQVHIGRRSICFKGTKAEATLISIPLSAVSLVECRDAPLLQSCLVLTVHLGKLSATLQALCGGPALHRPMTFNIAFARSDAEAVCAMGDRLAMPIQGALAKGMPDDKQDTLPEETPQKLPRELGRCKVSMSIPIYQPLPFKVVDHSGGAARGTQLSLSKAPMPAQLADDGRNTPHGEPPEASLLAGHVLLEEAAADDVVAALNDLDVLPESFVSPQCAQQVPWGASEHQEPPALLAGMTDPNRPLSQPAASDDLFLAKSIGTSATRTPVHSPTGDAAVSSQPRKDALSPAMAISLLLTERAQSSPCRLPAIQEAEVEGVPQHCSQPPTGVDGSGTDKRPQHLQAVGGRPGVARQLLWSQPKDKRADERCPPERATAAVPKCQDSPAPARNRGAAGNNNGKGAAAKKTGAARNGRGRGAGRAACQSPPPKARRAASPKQAQQGHPGKGRPGTRSQMAPAAGSTGGVYDFDANSPGMPATGADTNSPDWLAAPPVPSSKKAAQQAGRSSAHAALQTFGGCCNRAGKSPQEPACPTTANPRQQLSPLLLPAAPMRANAAAANRHPLPAAPQHQGLPGNGDAEDSGLSSSDRSDGFTQAVQNMQEGVSARLRPGPQEPCKQLRMPSARLPATGRQLLAPKDAVAGTAQEKGSLEAAPETVLEARKAAQSAGGGMEQMQGPAVKLRVAVCHTDDAAMPDQAPAGLTVALPEERNVKAASARGQPKGRRAAQVAAGKTAHAKPAKQLQENKARKAAPGKGKQAQDTAAKQPANPDEQTMADGVKAGGAQPHKQQTAAEVPTAVRGKREKLESKDDPAPKRTKQTELESDIELHFSDTEQQEAPLLLPLLPNAQASPQGDDAQQSEQEEEQDDLQQDRADERALLTPIPDLSALQHLQSMAVGAAVLLQPAQIGITSLRPDIDTALGKGPANKQQQQPTKRQKLTLPTIPVEETDSDENDVDEAPLWPAVRTLGSRHKAVQKPRRASKQKLRAGKHKGDGCEDEEAQGPSLKAVALQMVAALSPNADAADSDEEEGMAEVQLLLKRVMDHKKAAGRKKEAAILQAAMAEVAALMAAAEADFAKEDRMAKAALDKGTATYAHAFQQHQQRLSDIKAAFEAALAAEWAAVQKSGKRQAAFLKEAQLGQERRQAAHKRALAQVKQRAEDICIEAEAKVAAVRKKAGKMTGLARVLQPFARGPTPSQ